MGEPAGSDRILQQGLVHDVGDLHIAWQSLRQLLEDRHQSGDRVNKNNPTHQARFLLLQAIKHMPGVAPACLCHRWATCFRASPRALSWTLVNGLVGW